MNYNYEEEDIIREVYESYIRKEEYEDYMKKIVYEIIIYNDDSNINELINKYGGIEYLSYLYMTRYKTIDYKELSYINLLAYIGLYDYVYNKVNEIIIENFDINI